MVSINFTSISEKYKINLLQNLVIKNNVNIIALLEVE